MLKKKQPVKGLRHSSMFQGKDDMFQDSDNF